jgi:hypothetical protein
MRLQKLGRKIFAATFSLSLLLGMGVATTQTTNAQYPQWQRAQNRRDRDQRRNDRDWDRRRNGNRNGDRRGDGYPNLGGSYDLRQTALNAGYNKGAEAGREDQRKNDRYDFRDEGDYRNASKDYNSRLGSRGIYQQYFRLAFENGYADGYQGY